MALIIEDGTLVADANSYVTLEEARAYALARGVTLSAVDATLEVFVVKAMDWLESLRAKYQGVKVSADQSLQFPRVGLTVDGFEVAEDEIHPLLKKAQCQVIMDLAAGLDPQASWDGSPAVLREKVDVIETEYAESNPNGQLPYLRKAYSFLAPFLNNQGFFGNVTRV
jgi:hypothetical protein